MKRGKETEERARLEVFICLLAGCVKLKRCVKRTETCQEPASYQERNCPEMHIKDLHAVLCYMYS